ncbi:Succinate-semialdehyde dehydrogenase [NADP(+)] GabD [Raoultella terrigena]|uniref:Succinate-semialdehyde dehydrogenase [NADP(+)] GabD n=1 Tax=Raoultella terrigena TaxID=577 RepID=A0A4U9D6X3_RAOTE|nr:Succinate-semialdehyde dehydrogenase [NADP(+)] GabD [Raoultella terrigena]
MPNTPVKRFETGHYHATQRPNFVSPAAFIDGQWRDALSGEVITVTNPANDQRLGSVPKMGAEETHEAIDAANRALPAWRALTAKERAAILRRWFDLIMANQDDLARLMTLEQGKPLAKLRAKSATPPRLLNGSPKKVSASTATPFPAIRRISA